MNGRIIERIIERLKGLGYEFDNEKDGILLKGESEAGRDYLLAACNLSFIPKVLEGTYIDIVCGRFLKSKLYGSGGGLEESEVSGIIESITEGDVTLKYASGKELSEREKLEALISELLKKETAIAANRRLKW